MKKVAVVGAGAGGMAAAYDLARAGCRVTIFEADRQVGGLASGFKDEGWDWSVEKFYHHWFASDEHILGLIDELGWREQVLFPWPVTAAYHDGSFYPLDGPLSAAFPRFPWLDRLPGATFAARVVHLLRFPGLNTIEALRSGIVGLYLLMTAWEPLEKVTAASWLRSKMGDRNYKVLWEPLLEGKFGPYMKDVNMAWFWARVNARTSRLGTFEGGFQAFMNLFADRLRQDGVVIHLETPVEFIKPDLDGGLTLKVGEETHVFDQVLLTVSPGLTAKMVPDLPSEYLEDLFALRSMGAVVVILALKQQLSLQNVYWHNLPKSSGFPFLALVEHTNFLSPEYFGGEHIVYCGDYLTTDHEYFSLSQEELLDRFLAVLPKFNPDFKLGWVRKAWLWRTPYAQPVPPLNHSKSIPPLETPINGLWMANMSQVYPWDRGTNFAVEVGRKAASRMLSARHGEADAAK